VYEGVEACDDGNTESYDGCGNCQPSYNAKANGTVIDAAEELMWTRCLQPSIYSGGSCGGSGAGAYRYCGSNNNSCNAGINEGLLTGSGGSEAWIACASFSFAGYSDWRLPTKEELGGLVECSSGYTNDADSDEICLNEGFSESTVPWIFSAFAGPEIWTSTSKNEGDAWVVGFMRGYYDAFFKTTEKSVVCVRDNVEPADEPEVSAEWGAPCTQSADCIWPTNFCAIDLGQSEGFCSINCADKQACYDAGADEETWTCMGVFACDIAMGPWCGPATDLGGAFIECE
jgi:hypothetical protein